MGLIFLTFLTDEKERERDGGVATVGSWDQAKAAAT